jgi:predicted transcriptional regulator
MGLFTDTREDAENKVILLYFIDQIRIPITSMQLSEIMLDNNYINYFHLQQSVSDLISEGFLSETTVDSIVFLQITAEGIRILNMFLNIIPEGMRTRLLNGITAAKEGIRYQNTVTAEKLLLNEDEYQVILKVMGGDTSLIDLELSVGSREDARLICKNWKENAADLYPRIIALLLEG